MLVYSAAPLVTANLSEGNEGSDVALGNLTNFVLQPTRHMSMAREGKES